MARAFTRFFAATLVLRLGARRRYSPLHEKYQAKFESLITDFIESVGGTVEEFYKELKEDNERDPDGPNSIFTQILCAIADYDVFIQLMRETKEKEDEAESSEEEERPGK